MNKRGVSGPKNEKFFVPKTLKNRRGVSGVIVTVLFILIILAAIVILWSFIRVFILGGEITTGVLTTNLEIDAKSVNVNNTAREGSFIVKRNPGEGNVVALRVLMKDIDGEEHIFRVDGEVKEFQTKRIDLNGNWSASELGNLSRVEVYTVVLSDKEGDLKAPLFNVPSFPFPELSSTVFEPPLPSVSKV